MRNWKDDFFKKEVILPFAWSKVGAHDTVCHIDERKSTEICQYTRYMVQFHQLLKGVLS